MSDGVRFFSAGPISVIALLIIIGFSILLIPLFIFGIIGAAFIRLGFSWISALVVILLIVFGSFINIPVYRIRRDVIRVSRNHTQSPEVYMPSPAHSWDTSVSCNLGGAVIPAGVSLYLFFQTTLITGTSLVATVCAGIFIVAVITFVSTRMVPGSGIHVPLLIPGFTALLAGLVLTGGTGLEAAVTAFVSGIMGTLFGGNFANLFRLRDLEISDVSIGGAGTFGTIFICCILPALIA